MQRRKMSQLNEVNIDERSTIYDVKMSYHSDMKCENYDARIIGISESDNTITIRPYGGNFGAFTFDHSDPDRVITIAQMILSFAQAIKNENKMMDTIDTSANE